MFVMLRELVIFKIMITALTVNYNTPDLLENLLRSFRKFYDTDFLVIDGSNEENWEKIIGFANKYNALIIHFHFNIHHGPGMGYGIRNIKTEQILLIDTDVEILKGGCIEDLQSKLLPENYGIGCVGTVNENGVDAPTGYRYLHPSFALVNRDVVLKYPMPVRHGAPMIEAMKAGAPVQHEQWVADDLVHSFKKETLNNNYIIHLWSGTCRIGGMNL
jgi:hypothetical protein